MATIPEALQAALGHHQAGRLREAEQICRQILQAEPNHAEALHLVGVVALQSGDFQSAVDSIERAVRCDPNHAEAYNNLGTAYKKQGRLEEAIACYRQAGQIKPDYAGAHYNLGLAFKAQGSLDEAIACYRRAIQTDPDHFDTHNSLGNAHKERGELDQAIACYRQALALKPDHALSHYNLGLVLKEQGELEQAAASYRRAMQIEPHDPRFHNNLGNVVRLLGKLDEAVASYRRAVELKGDHAAAHVGLGITLLSRGRLEEGWSEYEWRLKCPKTAVSPYCRPLWDGSPLDGRTIMVFAEQGLGDVVQFVRYARLVQGRGGKVCLECPAPLARLLEGCRGVDQLVPQESPLPPFDVAAPLLSLPAIFGTTLENIPAKIPYLEADPTLVDHWRTRLSAVDGFGVSGRDFGPRCEHVAEPSWVAGSPHLAVGIAWQGNPDHAEDRWRSVPLEEFEPLARLKGVTLISLQKGPGAEQLSALQERFPVIDLGDQFDEESGAFMDTAAVMKHLDLVVTSDTATAHLAGALGVPVWVALAAVPDWRWMLDRDDSPWYPTMRLFRQRQPGDWKDVFRRIAAALEQFRADPAAAKPLPVPISSGALPGNVTGEEHEGQPLYDPGLPPNTQAESDDSPPAQHASSGVGAGQTAAGNPPSVNNPHLRMKHCRYGPMLYLANDRYIGRSLDRYGEFSQKELDLLGQIIRPGQTVLDVGASVGTHTIFFAHAVGPTGRVYAFEPQTLLFEVLQSNLALSGHANVFAYQSGVGRQSGTLRMPQVNYDGSGNFGGVSLSEDAQGEVVSLMTIDQLDLPACHLVKVDVEGMEGEVIAGAEATIRRLRPALYVENDRDEKSAPLIEQLLGLDYRLYWHLPPLFNPGNYFGVSENLFPGIVSANMLGIHNSYSQNISGLREIRSPTDTWQQ